MSSGSGRSQGRTDGGDATNLGTDAAEAGNRHRFRVLLSGTRIGQFVSIGAVGATLETVVVAVLTAGLTVPPLAAKAVGAEASISLMFLLNDRLTFADEGATDGTAVLRRWGRSHLVRLGGLSVAFATLFVLTSWTNFRLLVAGADFWPTVANLIGIGVGLTVNYVAESLFTWRVTEE